MARRCYSGKKSGVALDLARAPLLRTIASLSETTPERRDAVPAVPAPFLAAPLHTQD